MESITTSNQRVQYEKVGSGTPIVFIHGSFATSSAWSRVLSSMNLINHCALVIDLPGSGGSSEIPVDTSCVLSYDADAVKQMINSETTEPIHLVGHSYGGVIALFIAMTMKIPISTLTLFEPLPVTFLADTGDIETFEEIRSFFTDYRGAFESGDQWAVRHVIDLWGGHGVFDTLPLRVREAMANSTSQNISQWVSNFAYQPMLEEYQSISIPTSIVCGEFAHPTSQLISRRLHELIPDSVHNEVAGAGHFMIHSHAKESADIVNNSISINSI